MAFTVEDIKKYLKKPSAINEAIELNRAGYVNISSVGSFWKNDITVQGTVYTDDDINARFTLSNEKIVSCGCGCKEFLETKGVCVHVAALALAYAERKPENEEAVYTSAETRKIVNSYLNRHVDKYLEKSQIEVELKYKAQIQGRMLKISFYVGNGDKSYAIRNLYEFEKMFVTNDYMEYGRNYGICHNIDNFSDESKIMLLFVLKNIRMDKTISSISGANSAIIQDKSKMILAGENVDNFIDMLAGDNKKLLTDNQKSNIVYGNPELSITIEQVGNSGYKLFLNNISHFIKGNEKIYLIDDESVFCCDRDFGNNMGEFLENIFINEERMLTINRKDMASFCNAVLPVLTEYSDIDMPKGLKEDYEPWELKTRFELHSVDDDILLKVNATYNDDFFDLYRGVCRNKNVCRDYNQEYSLKNLLSKYFDETNSAGELKASGYKKIYELLSRGVKEIAAFGPVEMTEAVKNLKLVDTMKIGAKVVVDDNWLNLQIDAGDYSRRELELLIKSYREKKKYVKLNNHTLVKLDDNGLELLAGMAYDLDFTADELINNQIFVPKYRALYIDSRLGGNVSEYKKDSTFKTLVRTIKQVEDSEIPIPKGFNKILRDYQKHGFRWMKTLDICGFGGILADDMGLGKTIQVLTLLSDEYLINSNTKKSIIVAPTSLIYNWENEILNFAPDLKYVAVTGAKSERIKIIEQTQADVIITSYELLKRDIDEYKKFDFRFQIIDEAQNIKNHTTNNARAVKKIKAETKFALTGTPIENRLSELWSIFDYIMPGFLYSSAKFREKFEIPIVRDNQLEARKGLTRIISPFIMRRIKSQVLKELPDKMEYELFAKMEGEQHKLYTANALKLKEDIANQEGSQFSENKIKILAELTRLRQICCDPSLCYENYEDESSKLDLCIDLIKNSIEGGHKILLFSQFTSMLDIISKRLEKEEISYYMMTGATKKEERMNIVGKFNKDNTNVFLISLKVGGTGLNLTGADIVIHYDPWWNMAVQNQATDRAHRIGQDKVVSVFKLIAKNTIEENIIKLQKSKVKLSDDVLTGENISISRLSKDELLSILNG
ncbi:MAG: DEAD/DEAH box helicase family protein [Clostridiales bacterium]|nr:DEAD/DEAH box helicase family protein [Clostridiales bacterium]